VLPATRRSHPLAQCPLPAHLAPFEGLTTGKGGSVPCSLPQASTSAGARVYTCGGYVVTPGKHVRESRTLPTQAHTHTHTGDALLHAQQLLVSDEVPAAAGGRAAAVRLAVAPPCALQRLWSKPHTPTASATINCLIPLVSYTVLGVQARQCV
jgi:hypothetical protein